MPNFIFAYHGSGKRPDTEQEAAEGMAKWKQWFSDNAEAIVDPGNPVGMSKTVFADGTVEDHGGANPLAGYMVIKAADMDAVIGIAKTCPLPEGGSLEIAEIVEMNL